jgi:phage repressor protein C with HTH and peptisase S24 domain
MLRPSEPAPKDAKPMGHGAGRAAFVARLQTILQHWPSADRLARAVGVSPSAFRKWLRGEAEPSRERLVALADATSVSIAWLAKGEGPEPRFQEMEGAERGPSKGSVGEGGFDPRRFVVLPKRSEAAAAGAGTPPSPAIRSEFIAFGHEWIRDTLGLEPTDLLLETAVGESMQPTIRDNDLLLIDITDRKLREFGIYVLEYQGERLVKRVQRKLDGSLLLISDNEIYEPERIPPERAREVTVVGRVVWGGGRI